MSNLKWAGNPNVHRALMRMKPYKLIANVYPRYKDSQSTLVELVLPGKEHIKYYVKEPIIALVEHDVKKTMEEYW